MKQSVVYFKKEYDIRLFVLGFEGTLAFLVDKVELGQRVLLVLRFPVRRYPSNLRPISLTDPADRPWAPPYVTVLQQTERTTKRKK